MKNKQPMKFELPALLSNKQVAEKIGIDRRNMGQQRKSKTNPLPEPVAVVDGFPLWLESEVDEWMVKRDGRKAMD